MDVLGLAAFDYDLDAIHNPKGKVVESLEYVIASQKRSLISSIPFHRYLPTSVNRKFYNSKSAVDELSDMIITERRKHPANSKTADVGVDNASPVSVVNTYVLYYQ